MSENLIGTNGAKKISSLNSEQILEGLRKTLKLRCHEEFIKWGKCNNLMSDQELADQKAKMHEEEEEKPIDSLQYNKMLLERSMCKYHNEEDLRHLIRRVMAREKPRKQPKINKDEREKIMKTFTTKEIWDTCAPADFIGDKLDYLIYLREQKKEKEAKKNK